MIAMWRDELENAIVNHCPVFGHYTSDNPRDLVPQSFMEVISFPDKIAVDYKGQLKAADTIDDIIRQSIRRVVICKCFIFGIKQRKTSSLSSHP